MSDSTSVNVDLVGVYNGHLSAIKEIDAKLVGLKGTMAAILKEATDNTVSTPLVDALKAIGLDGKAWQKENVGLFGLGDRTLGDFVNGLRSLLEGAETFVQHTATDWIKSHKTDLDDGAGLRARRAELVAMAEATANVVSQFVGAGVLPADTKLEEIPKVQRTSGGSSSSGKASAIRFYKVLEDGTKEYYAEGYDLSRVAWYQPFAQCGAAALKAGLTEAGWDGTLTTSQEYAVKVTHPKLVENGAAKVIEATIGWEIVQPEATAPAAEDTKEDEAK